MPKIQESAENYLETILVLKERNGTVRSVDIAAEMGFSKPSVSVAMRNLREQDCITMCEDGLISLMHTLLLELYRKLNLEGCPFMRNQNEII